MDGKDPARGAEFTKCDLSRMYQEVLTLRSRVRQAEGRAYYGDRDGSDLIEVRAGARPGDRISAKINSTPLRCTLRSSRTVRAFSRRRGGRPHGMFGGLSRDWGRRFGWWPPCR
jgi:hypothetical protein